MAKVRTPSRRIALLILLAISAFLIALPSRWTERPRNWVLSYLSPAQRFLKACQRPLVNTLRSFRDVWSAEREVQKLRKKNRELEIANRQLTGRLRALERRIASLQILQDLHAKEQLKGIWAPVVGVDISEQRDTIIVAAGASKRVRKNLPVVWEDAAVGKVVAVGPSASRVALLTDVRCRARVIISRTGDEGILTGVGNGKCRIKYLTTKSSVRRGDSVLMSGRDGVFPRYVVAGIVTKVKRPHGQLFLDVEVKPFLALKDVQDVFIVTEMPDYNEGL